LPIPGEAFSKGGASGADARAHATAKRRSGGLSFLHELVNDRGGCPARPHRRRLKPHQMISFAAGR
jgi:hypothetical protein